MLTDFIISLVIKAENDRCDVKRLSSAQCITIATFSSFFVVFFKLLFSLIPIYSKLFFPPI